MKDSQLPESKVTGFFMRNKLLNGVNMKIAAATSVVIFTLLVSFMGAYAWFQSNKMVDDNASSMSITPSNGILKKLSIHELDFDNNNGYVTDATTGRITGYIFNSVAKSEININWRTAGTPSYNINVPSLGQYSVLQKTNPLLLVFELSEPLPSKDVSIVATAAKQYTPQEYGTASSAETNPLSWVVKYSNKVFTGESMSKVDFTIMKDTLLNEGHFANTNGSGTVTSFDKTQTFYSGSDTTNITFVCVVLDYFEEAMDYFFSSNIDKEFISDTEHDVPFDVDWTMVI